MSPLRVSIASLAMLPWENLIKWCDEYGVLEKFPQEGGVPLDARANVGV